jgi:hypothetical protein
MMVMMIVPVVAIRAVHVFRFAMLGENGIGLGGKLFGLVHRFRSLAFEIGFFNSTIGRYGLPASILTGRR